MNNNDCSANTCSEQNCDFRKRLEQLDETNQKLSSQLVLERFKNQIYRQLIENNTKIIIGDIVTEEEDGLHVWTGNGILPIHIHEISILEKGVFVKGKEKDQQNAKKKMLQKRIIKDNRDFIVEENYSEIYSPKEPVISLTKKLHHSTEEISRPKSRNRHENVIDSVDDNSKYRKQSYRSIKTYLGTLVQEEPSENDRNEKIVSIDSKIQKILDEFGDPKETEKSFQDTFVTLKQSRVYTKILNDLSKTRASIFAKMTIASYQNLLTEQIRTIEDIFREKNYSDKKSMGIISKGLSPLESRLIFYGNYTQSHIEIDEIQKLDIALDLEKPSPKEYVPYNSMTFFNCFYNYGLILFPMKKNLKRYLLNRYNFSNVVYLPLPKNTKDDPYSFYVLDKVVKEKRYWKMDCRLEELSSTLIANILPYMIGMFRKLYKDVFGDNDFRSDFSSKCQLTECDCEQLFQNIILVGQPKEFYNVVREMVRNKITYIPTENDKFNLYGDDSLQRKRFHEKEDVDMVDIIKQLFDDISSEQSVDFYRSRTSLK